MSNKLLNQELTNLRELYKTANPKERARIKKRAELIKKALEWSLPEKTFSYSSDEKKLNDWRNLEKNALETLL